MTSIGQPTAAEVRVRGTPEVPVVIPPPVFRKTQMCKFHALGRCKRGAGCFFAHSFLELKETPNLQFTRMCHSVLDGKECVNLECKYAHRREELRGAHTLDLLSRAACGSEATPDLAFTRMCSFVLKGKKCHNPECKYAHRRSELRDARATVVRPQVARPAPARRGRLELRDAHAAGARPKTAVPASARPHQRQADIAEDNNATGLGKTLVLQAATQPMPAGPFGWHRIVVLVAVLLAILSVAHALFAGQLLPSAVQDTHESTWSAVMDEKVAEDGVNPPSGDKMLVEPMASVARLMVNNTLAQFMAYDGSEGTAQVILTHVACGEG